MSFISLTVLAICFAKRIETRGKLRSHDDDEYMCVLYIRKCSRMCLCFVAKESMINDTRETFDKVGVYIDCNCKAKENGGNAMARPGALNCYADVAKLFRKN